MRVPRIPYSLGNAMDHVQSFPKHTSRDMGIYLSHPSQQQKHASGRQSSPQLLLTQTRDLAQAYALMLVAQAVVDRSVRTAIKTHDLISMILAFERVSSG